MSTRRTLKLTTAAAPLRAGSWYPAKVLAAVPADPEGGTDAWTQLMKQGEFYDPRYGNFAIDAGTYTSIVENFQRLTKAVPGDYDHAFAENGNSRACGWVKELQVRGDELWGLVSWTDSAAAAIRAGEYRYISPEFTYDYVDEQGGHHGPALIAFGLTNRPFLEGMREVTLAVAASGAVILNTPAAAGTPTLEEPQVDLKKMALALGLAETASEDEILAAAAKLRDGAPGDVTLSKQDHDALLAAAAEGEAAKKQAHDTERNVVLTAAETELKIPPAHRPVWEAQFDRDPDGTKKLLAEMKPLPVTTLAGTTGGGKVDDGELPADAPRPARVHALAEAKMKATQGLSYVDAVRAADLEIDRPAV